MYSYWSFGKLQIHITNEIYIYIDSQDVNCMNS